MDSEGEGGLRSSGDLLLLLVRRNPVRRSSSAGRTRRVQAPGRSRPTTSGRFSENLENPSCIFES